MIRHSGNQADKQTGSPAIWQDGHLGWLKYLIFLLFLATPFDGIAQYVVPRGLTQNSTTYEPCTEDCGHESEIDKVEKILPVVQGWKPAPGFAAVENECPESVKSIRQVMALTYGTCEALKPFSWSLLKKSDGNEYFIRNNGSFLDGYSSAPNCDYTDDAISPKSCNHIANYGEVKETHPYNRMDKTDACKAQMQCGGQPCLSTFALAGESYALHDIGDNNINIFAHNTTGYNNQGPNFLGWNCSEYVTTAMALAGQRLVKPGENCGGKKGGNLGEQRPIQWFDAATYSDLANANRQNCSCLSEEDITGPNASIKPGDIITLDKGHVMIVEAVEQPFFKDPDSIGDCEEDKISFDQLQIRVNHSSGTTAGPSSIRFYEYESLRYRQSLTHAANRYIEECIEENNSRSTKEACWDDLGLQEEYKDYLFSIQQLNSSVGNGVWKETGEIFNNDNDEDRYPKWPKMRKYLSAVCKARFHRKQGRSVPSNVTDDLASMKEAFKVIRHKDGEPGCETPENERPQLKHKECLGECINEEENQCPTYGIE